MRKTIFTALVTLLVMLAVVSCDNTLGADKSVYTDDGLVALTITTGEAGNIRSLTAALAHEQATYVEVIFKSGSPVKYYRSEGFYSEGGLNLTVHVPADTYNSSNAVMLIGRKSDATLLATGYPTAAVTVPTNLSIKFTVTSLTADISAKTLASSSFKIENLTGTPTTTPAITTAYLDGTNIFDETNASSVCFQVPPSTTNIGASLTIGGLTNTGANIFVIPKAIATDPEPAKIKFIGIGSAPVITPTLSAPLTEAAVGATGKNISFIFSSTTVGKYIITFDVPVVGFSSEVSTPTGTPAREWHIRGGTNSNLGQPDYLGQTTTSGTPPVIDPTKRADEEGVPLIVTNSTTPLYGLGVTDH